MFCYVFESPRSGYTERRVKMTVTIVTIVTIVTNAVTNILGLSGRHRGLPLHVYVKIDLFGD